MLKYLLHPSTIRTTPQLLATELHIKTRRWPSPSGFQYSECFLMTYPPPEALHDHPDVYPSLAAFYRASKLSQRQHLSRSGIPVPETYGTRYEAAYAADGTWIVRPFRHSGGRQYRRTNSSIDFVEGQQYVSRVFPKTAEYRIVFVFGSPLVILKKQNPQHIPADLPWNHLQGCSFATLSNPQGSHIWRCGLVGKLADVPIIKYAHICAVDVLWSDTLGPSVCEVNSCPGITIPTNLTKVATYVRHTYDH